jgi:dolichyl-phosphate beta-glucosyltransferase
MSHQNLDLSIIMPAYKEADLIKAKLAELAKFLSRHPERQVEVLVVANCPDDTAQAALTMASRFKHFHVVDEQQRLGKGGAVRLGMFEAHGRYRMFMDSDLSTPLHHLEEVFSLMDQNTKVAIGVRDLWRIHKGLARKSMSKAANLAAQILVIPGVKDTQCGFKLFEAAAAEEIFGRQTMTSWSFDIEILGIARKLGYKIDQINLPDWKDPKKVGLVGDSMLGIVIKGFLDPFKIRWNLWTGKYKRPTYRHSPHPKNYCSLGE